MVRSTISANPNATAALSSGSLATLVVWIAEQLGLDVNPTTAAAIATAVATVALFIGARGVRGVARLLWRGDES